MIFLLQILGTSVKTLKSYRDIRFFITLRGVIIFVWPSMKIADSHSHWSLHSSVKTCENPDTPLQSFASNVNIIIKDMTWEKERERCDLGVGGARLRQWRGRRGGRRGRSSDVRAGRVYVEGLEEEQHAAARHRSLVPASRGDRPAAVVARRLLVACAVETTRKCSRLPFPGSKGTCDSAQNMGSPELCVW
jgi:hypothetical protein